MVTHIFTTDDDAGHGFGGIRIEPGPYGGFVVDAPGDTYSFEDGTGTYRMLVDLLGKMVLNQVELNVKAGENGSSAYFRFGDANGNTLGLLTAYPGGMLLQSAGSLTIETLAGISTLEFDPVAGTARLYMPLNMGSNRITALVDGLGPTDAATVGQLPRLEQVALTPDTARNDNLNVGSSALLVFARIAGPTGAFGISGLVAPASPQVVILHNTTSYDMTIYNENANSTASNRIRSTLAADLLTTGRGNVTLVYDMVGARWVDLGFRA